MMLKLWTSKLTTASATEIRLKRKAVVIGIRYLIDCLVFNLVLVLVLVLNELAKRTWHINIQAPLHLCTQPPPSTLNLIPHPSSRPSHPAPTLTAPPLLTPLNISHS